MGRGAVVWSILFLTAGTLIAARALPGAEDWAAGPHIGMAALLLMLGSTMLAVQAMPWILRRTTRPEDYQGGCPVGASCLDCGAFNLKPRTTCRSCGRDLTAPRETEAL